MFCFTPTFCRNFGKLCLIMLTLAKETSQKSCLNLSFIQVWPIIRANDSDPVLPKSAFACLNYCLFFQWISFDGINGGQDTGDFELINVNNTTKSQSSKSIHNATNRCVVPFVTSSINDVKLEGISKDGQTELKRIIKEKEQREKWCLDVVNKQNGRVFLRMCNCQCTSWA